MPTLQSAPSSQPTSITAEPTRKTKKPTEQPTGMPTLQSAPSSQPTSLTSEPTRRTKKPTAQPTGNPTPSSQPTVTHHPTGDVEGADSLSRQPTGDVEGSESRSGQPTDSGEGSEPTDTHDACHVEYKGCMSACPAVPSFEAQETYRQFSCFKYIAPSVSPSLRPSTTTSTGALPVTASPTVEVIRTMKIVQVTLVMLYCLKHRSKMATQHTLISHFYSA